MRSYSSIDQIKWHNASIGHHWFEPATLRFFGGRVLPTIYGGRFFISSERSGFDYNSPRKYSIRECQDGQIETVGEFCAYWTRAQAIAAVRAHVRSLEGTDDKALAALNTI